MQEPINTVTLETDKAAEASKVAEAISESTITNSEARSMLENIVIKKPNRTKNIKGAFGKPKMRVDPTPTPTELSRMVGAAIIQGSRETVSVFFDYVSKKIDWKTAYSKARETGFTTFGYRRGFVGAVA